MEARRATEDRMIPLIGLTLRKIAAPAIIHASKYWTPKRMAEQSVFAGRKSKNTVGTHIDNLVANRKLVMLSPSEARKFKPLAKRHRYVLRRSMPIARGLCDASGEFHAGCIVFFPEEIA